MLCVDNLVERAKPENCKNVCLENLNPVGTLKENESTPLLSFVVTNFNGASSIIRCLQLILRSDYPRFEVIVVDDNSTDRSLKLIAQNFAGDERVKVYKNPRNMGAAASRNRGASLASGCFICFVDNDTLIESDYLAKGVSILRLDPSIGIVSPLIFDSRSKCFYAGHDVGLYTGRLIVFRALPLRGYNSRIKCALLKVPMVGANCLLIRKELFDDVDGFDEYLNIPYEDSDFCLKVRHKGYSVMALKDCVAYHFGKQRKSGKHLLGALRNKIIFVKRHGKWAIFVFFIPVWIIVYLVFMALNSKLVGTHGKP